MRSLPPEIGQLTNLEWLVLDGNVITFPPAEIQQQGVPAMLAYLRDYETMLMRQTIAGVGAMAGVLLAFRWRQRRGLNEEKKRL